MSFENLLNAYRSGPDLLHSVLVGMRPHHLDAAPIPGRWSTRQVICHLADAELVYADRIKRVLAEDRPPLRSMDPNQFAARLAYAERDLEIELQTVAAVRRHLDGILQNVTEADLERVGIHSEDGPLTLKSLLERITEHIPHHARTIVQKRRALGLTIDIAGREGGAPCTA